MLTQLPTFQAELQSLINRYSIENVAKTPDFILAQYMNDCLSAFTSAIQQRDRWHGHGHWLTIGKWLTIG